MYRQTDRQTDL